MKFTAQPLPYPTDALVPLMSAETLEYHWGKHYIGYLDKLNMLLEGSDFEKANSLEEIIFKSDGAIYNNAAQAWNHQFFFAQFSENPKGLPEGDLLLGIGRSFGSYDNFLKEFKEIALNLFGSGWVWLTADENRDLYIIATQNAQNPAADEGLRPLMVIDIWEHAYYLDHQNRRADFIANFFKLLDWGVIERRY